MSVEEWEMIVQVENPVDLLSLAHHGCDLRGIYQAQDLLDYIGMLNGPTYLTLVRHFWVRAQLYDLKASQLEMEEKVLIDPSLKGKTRAEMGLEPFRHEEIRSSLLGIPVVISVDTIAKVIRRASEGRFVYNLKGKNNSWIPIVNRTMFHSVDKGKYKDLDIRTKMLLKIQNENLLPKGNGGDIPSLDHRVFLHFFLTREKANVPKYIFKHLIKNLKDSQFLRKSFVPYGRLLSEIFHQGGILNTLKEVNYFTDAQLGTVTGHIINGATLVSMKYIQKADYKELSTDLKESSIISNLMNDFPPICKQDPVDVQVMFIKEYFETTGQVIKISDIPEEMYGGTLPIAKNRNSLKRKMTEAEYLDETPKSAKVAKTSVSQASPSAFDTILEDSEAKEQVDPEHFVEITSGSSVSSESSDSSELDESTQSLIDKIIKSSKTASGSAPLETDSVNQHSSSHSAILQDIGKLSERRVEICNQLPVNHPFQPPTIEPLQMILPESVTKTMVPESVQVTTSESFAAVTVPKHTSLKTPQKATKTVPEKTDLVNQQQQPEPIKQTPKQTSTSTPSQSSTPSQTQTKHSPQKAIPEPVVETMVPKSVQVTESEPSVTITVSEPTKKTNNQTAINDQPSSSSTIQTTKSTNPNLLKSEFLESEIMNLNADLQKLVQLRRSSSLTVDYQDRWTTLKGRASELLNLVSLKCIKIHEAANLHRISKVHLIEEDPAPLLLAYTPFYHKSEYLTREGREVKLLKERAQKEQEAAKAREDLLLQKQQELEAALKRQEALIAQLMNKQA